MKYLDLQAEPSTIRTTPLAMTPEVDAEVSHYICNSVNGMIGTRTYLTILNSPRNGNAKVPDRRIA